MREFRGSPRRFKVNPWTANPAVVAINTRCDFSRPKRRFELTSGIQKTLALDATEMDFSKRWPDFLIPAGLIACLAVILVPLPPAVMDVLLAANLTVAVIMLLAVVYAKTPMELSLFPTFLLGATFARLALNIGTTRLILTRGHIDQENAAGSVVASFSSFVTGDSLAVGLVIFAIIVVIQFVVIAKGATRISEVSARFSLDGMPGKQMAIEAELNAGTIDGQQARDLRRLAGEQADFYGAMDGASKFVKGDAIAGISITVINIVGGLIIGLSQGMAIGDATGTFTKLTIGDGLVSQIPALLIAMAAGLLVTRSQRSVDLSRESMGQISKPIVLITAAVFLGLLVLTELPALPLIVIASGCLAFAWMSAKSAQTTDEPEIEKPQPAADMSMDRLLQNDLISIELGVDLIALADSSKGGKLLQLISSTRQKIAAEMGMVLPRIRVRDNLTLPRNEYRILIQANAVDRGVLEPNRMLAIDLGGASKPLDNGIVVGLASENIASPGYWIEPQSWERAELSGYRVRTAAEVLVAQLRSTSIRHASDLMTRDAAAQLVEELGKTSPAIVKDVIPNSLPLGGVQKVLQKLLAEGVSVRPLHLIMETIGEVDSADENMDQLVETIRVRLGRHIVGQLADHPEDPIGAFSISSELQDRIACAWDPSKRHGKLDLPKSIVEMLVLAMSDAAQRMSAAGIPPVAVISQSIRPAIVHITQQIPEEIFVLGDQEAGNAPLQLFGEITLEQLSMLERAAA